jgi:hypothetical protein
MDVNELNEFLAVCLRQFGIIQLHLTQSFSNNFHNKYSNKDWWALVPSGALVPNFSKFFVALYLGHIKSKLDQPKAFLDQLTELYLISLNLKSYDHFENF